MPASSETSDLVVAIGAGTAGALCGGFAVLILCGLAPNSEAWGMTALLLGTSAGAFVGVWCGTN